MVSCGTINCGNSSSKLKTDDVEGWHNVPHEPKDMLLRQKWLFAMKRDPPYPKNEHFSVCGLHFADECFERDLRYQLQGGKRNFKLIATAVSTIFDFEDKLQHGKVSGETRKRVSSQKREDKRRKSESIEEACCSYSTMKPESRKRGCRSKSSETSCDTTLDLLDYRIVVSSSKIRLFYTSRLV